MTPLRIPEATVTSPKKLQANQTNAKASTGPKTARGKAVSSANATRHGMLSRELLLPHEDPAEFDELLGALIGELGAVGTLECTLVERIAVAIWRQRRLVRAEHRDIQLQNDVAAQGPENDAKAQKIHAMPDADICLITLSGEPFASNLEALERELRMLPTAKDMTLAEFERDFPLASGLYPVPESNGQEEAAFAKGMFINYGQPQEWLAKWLPLIQIAKARRASSEAARAALRAISTPSDTDRLARYQAALDNEWYKAMRAFREARKYRLSSLESIQNYETKPNMPGPALPDAA
jgi:hypothetical protein